MSENLIIHQNSAFIKVFKATVVAGGFEISLSLVRNGPRGVVFRNEESDAVLLLVNYPHVPLCVCACVCECVSPKTSL